ncbi:ArsR/SmtB family transcription factor [Sphingomicrobium lutaoense]|uniref:ArsR family transcriptional regulator n=1 Tax=Sphingomicrobium lutaoense TaxID=515949 RepID=A0A839YVR5_9SPHN|nr:metalloregulator ArsR/SmtB family transcription factor [Sphingomicrobium lutaoense]MBB3764311.1 ArsR family transcriptional regulator [Sphingomicrobium lutaoense]
MSGGGRLSTLFQALADPTRLRILSLVRSMELAVGELAGALGQSQPRVSRHLRILEEAGLIRRRREGAWVFVEMGDSALTGPLAELIDEATNEEDRRRFAEDAARLEAVRDERAEAAERWFAEKAGEWDQLRSLHVEEARMESAIARALGPGPLGRLVDIGTGTGRMIQLFSARASEAIGIDRSTEMLRLARVKLDAAGVTNASLRQGDMFALPLRDASADCVILHLVLHYAENPAKAISEAARILKPGGQMLIADFAPHDHEELRKVHRHRRLGFSDRAMADWLAAAGLEGDDPVKLEGGQLTVSIWRAEQPGRRDGGRRAA